jgi:hypothetical protein
MAGDVEANTRELTRAESGGKSDIRDTRDTTDTTDTPT